MYITRLLYPDFQKFWFCNPLLITFCVTSSSQLPPLHYILSYITPDSSVHTSIFQVVVPFTDLQHLCSQISDWFLGFSDWFHKYVVVLEGADKLNSSLQYFLIRRWTWRLWTWGQTGFCCPPSMRLNVFFATGNDLWNSTILSGIHLLWEDRPNLVSNILYTSF